MFHKFSAKCFSTLTTSIAALVFCWFILPGTGWAGDEHDRQKLHDSSERHDEQEEHGDHEKTDAGHDDHDDGKEIVHLTDAELEEFGVELAVASPGTLRMEVTVPGEISVNIDKFAQIMPRFSGVVKQVNKRIGDPVAKGEVLAIIESNEGLVPYEIVSLIEGTVIEKRITIGEVPGEDTPVFVIANLDTVWVNLSIYLMHLPYVRLGQEVVISAGQEIPGATGRISYLSPIVDEHTRTATARVVLENKEGQWRPGLFVEGRITTKKEEVAILVPKTSLERMGGRDVIFVKTENSFEPQHVQVGRSNHTSAEILSGLVSGQQYVSKGGFTLKAELQKSSLTGGHGH